jgi:hypothetical protein
MTRLLFTPEERIPPPDAIGTLRWMRNNIGLPLGLEEHIDELLKRHDQAVLNMATARQAIEDWAKAPLQIVEMFSASDATSDAGEKK